MGGYGGLIAQNMVQTGQEDLARNRQLEDEQRRTKLGILNNAYAQTTDPAQRQQIQDAIGSLYPTPAHAPTFLSDVIHLKHRQMQQQASPASPPAAPEGSGEDLGVPQAVPAPISQVAQAPTAADAWKAIAAIPSPVENSMTAARNAADNAQELQRLKNEGTEKAATIRSQHPMGRPVPFGSGSISAKDAKSMSQTGMAFPDQSGNQIDVSQLPEGTKITPWAWGDKIFYTIGDQKPRVITADNQRTVQPEMGALSPAGEAPSLGLARVPTASTHQVPGMNPGETITLQSTSTPVTPNAPVSSATPANPGARMPGTRPSGGAVKRSKIASPVAPTGPLGPPPSAFAPGTMLSQGRMAQPVVASMNTVAAQVFGNENEPPIWDHAWMFDKPEIRTALNKALTLNALSLPGTHEDPSFLQTLATAVGATGWSQQQIADANIRARQELERVGGPEALKMFARMAGMQEDLSALRTATRGSAAQGSIQTLVRAAPVYNVSSSQNFKDQLGVTLNTAASAMSGYPAINPEYLKWFKNGASLAQQSSPRSGKTPNGPSTHSYAIDANGKRRKVLDPNAQLPAGWKWGD